jgi:hypothetical protein
MGWLATFLELFAIARTAWRMRRGIVWLLIGLLVVVAICQDCRHERRPLRPWKDKRLPEETRPHYPLRPWKNRS